jgi:hypothetical protein
LFINSFKETNQIMQVTTISAEFGYTKNLGNFQSAKVGAQVWAQISEEEDAEGSMQYLFELVKQAVRDNIPQQQNQGVTVQRVIKEGGGVDNQ